MTLELLAALMLGGVVQALLLVLVQAAYLKRSSLGVRLEALRTEVAIRDREIRTWVKDSLAQMEADSITRDVQLRVDFSDAIKKQAEDPGHLNHIAERVGANVAARFAKALSTVKGNDTLNAIGRALSTDGND